MIRLPEPEAFQRQLRAWSVRGVFCATPSFVMAVLIGLYHPLQVVAMLAAVATYILGFAWGTALPAYPVHSEKEDRYWALNIAANARAAFFPVMFFGPDLFLGSIAVTTVAMFSEMNRFHLLCAETSFGQTYLIALTQGALVSLSILLLMIVFWCARRLGALPFVGNGIAVVAEPRDGGGDGPL